MHSSLTHHISILQVRRLRCHWASSHPQRAIPPCSYQEGIRGCSDRRDKCSTGGGCWWLWQPQPGIGLHYQKHHNEDASLQTKFVPRASSHCSLGCALTAQESLALRGSERAHSSSSLHGSSSSCAQSWRCFCSSNRWRRGGGLQPREAGTVFTCLLCNSSTFHLTCPSPSLGGAGPACVQQVCFCLALSSVP